MSEGLRVLVVDDESLARSRLRTLLSDCRSPAAVVAGEAGNATEAMEALRRDTFDALLLDVRSRDRASDSSSTTRTRSPSLMPVPPS